MGCKQSKASRVQVAPVKGAPARNTTIGNSRNTLQGSKSSLQNGCEDNRYGSATSKLSKQSKDSGFSVNEPVVDDEPDAYSHIITEESDSTLIQQVEASFQPQELDLCLTGLPAPRNLSARERARLDEQRILESLRNEGLISTSKFEGRSGLAFDVVEAAASMKRGPPARLAKLKKKKKRAKTAEEIAEKLERAEQRRKEAEQERLEKITAVSGKATSLQEEEVKQQQQELLLSATKKADAAELKRQQQLQLRKEKQKAREERAAEVRERKRLHANMNAASPQAAGDTIADGDKIAAESNEPNVGEE